jgi:hypothetical protein
MIVWCGRCDAEPVDISNANDPSAFNIGNWIGNTGRPWCGTCLSWAIHQWPKPFHEFPRDQSLANLDFAGQAKFGGYHRVLDGVLHHYIAKVHHWAEPRPIGTVTIECTCGLRSAGDTEHAARRVHERHRAAACAPYPPPVDTYLGFPPYDGNRGGSYHVVDGSTEVPDGGQYA